VDEERLRRVYALNSESNVSSVPDVVMAAAPSTLAPSGRAYGDSAAAGAAGHANEEAAGGGASEAPAPSQMEEAEEDALMDDAGFDSEEEEQEDDDGFIDEEVGSDVLLVDDAFDLACTICTRRR